MTNVQFVAGDRVKLTSHNPDGSPSFWSLFERVGGSLWATVKRVDPASRLVVRVDGDLCDRIASPSEVVRIEHKDKLA